MHLNTWLADNGYLALKPYFRGKDPGFFAKVDWSRTRAYNLGINGLYINLKGRERNGIVDPAQRKALMDEIKAKLLAAVDPATDKPAVTRVYQLDEYFKYKDYLSIGPDMVVGYAKMTRGSNESAMGEIPEQAFEDNLEEWNGDHCMDHESVPGILITSRPLTRPAPSLDRLAEALLAEYGVQEFPTRK
jgi:predicted AlkP superfamily phosphohydrolase/phosphomutase